MWPFKKADNKQPDAAEARATSLENGSVPISSDAVLAILGWNTESAAGVNVSIHNADDCVPVWAAVNFLSKTIAKLPLNVYRMNGDDREKARGDKIHKLLHDAPNPETTSFDWRKQMMQDALLGGRHITMIVRNNAGRVIELRPMPYGSVTVSRRDGKKRYAYQPEGGATQYFGAEDVIDIPWALSFDGVTHKKPVAKLRNAIGLYMAQEAYASKVFQNGGVPPMQLVGTFTNAAGAKRAQDDVVRAIAEAADAKRPVTAMPAGYELKPVGADPGKMQMVDGRQYQLGEIARIYAMPKVFLQDLTGATYSNTEQQDLHLVKHTVTAWLKQIEQELNLKLFGGPTNRFAEFDVDGLLRGDFKSRMEGYSTGIQNAILTPNEARAKENRPAVEHGDKTYIQGGTVPLGTQPLPAQSAGGTEPPAAEGEDDGA